MKDSRLDILYCISHGFALRMVLQTNLLNKIADKGFKVGLIGQGISKNLLADIEIDPEIRLINFEPEVGFWAGHFLVLRNYILEDVKGNVALWDKHLTLKRNAKGNLGLKIKLMLYMGAFYSVRLLPFVKKLYLRLEKQLLNSKQTDTLLQQLMPKEVVSTYPVHWSEALLIHSANKLGIATTIHLLSWDNISCKGRFPALAKKYLAWGPLMENELIEYYQIDSNAIQVVGVPHFDVHVDTVNGSNTGTLEVTKPYLFFAMSAPRFAPNEIDIVEWLATQVTEGVFGDNMNLVVRPHPQNVTGSMADASWVERLKKINKGKVNVDFPNLASGKLAWAMQQKDMFRMSQLLHGALVCLNSGSTMSIDSLMVNTPVIFTSFDADNQLPYWMSAKRLIDFPHLKKFTKIGDIPVADNFETLHKLISEVINNNGIVSKSMERVLEQECSSVKGNSTQNVVKYFCESIKSVPASAIAS